jgi:hypothetical protein
MFGNKWMVIMEATHYSKEELAKMQKEMTPFYVLQLVLTVITTYTFATLSYYIPDVSIYCLALWTWLGVIVPTQIAGIIWANTKKKFWLSQIAIMNVYQLVAIMISAYIISM